jgi:hypothetical protein
MKRVYLYVASVLAIIGAIYLWGHRDDFNLLRAFLAGRSSDGFFPNGESRSLQWRLIDRPNLGFRLQMPGDPSRVNVEADTETGSTEPVNMLMVKSENGGEYAVAWAERPPVARMNDLNPEKTIDQALDGALARTGTTLVSESRNSPQGFPGRDVVARNVGGGVLDTRFIYAGARLYMLIATAPSAAARHLEDVNRFFDSFTIASKTHIPETLPPATQ